ncbi:MAG: Leucyl aminopeptidase [Frankiales bacterium]|nr:Leucyl aminopeptidase [Frankiales bacterium]
MTRTLVVMGVSGSGKTTVGRGLAHGLGWVFTEGDEHHPPDNVSKMAAGTPLTDEDRWPWLAELADWIGRREAGGEDAVLTCSALKRSYRDLLRDGHPSVRFVHLTVSPETLRERLAQRQGHYMPASLLDSQLAALEPLAPGEPGLVLPGDGPPADVVAALAAWVGSLPVTSLSLASGNPTSLKVDALVVGIAKGPKGPVLTPGGGDVVKSLGKGFLTALQGLGATGKAEEVTRVAVMSGKGPAVVVAVGLGETTTSYDGEALRRAAGAAIRALAGTKKVGFALPVADADAVRAVAEGAVLGAYAFTRYRTTSAADQKAPVADVVVVVPDAKDKAAKAALRRAEVVASAVCLTRDLVNTPPSDLHPAELADVAKAECGGAGVTVEVLDEKALTKGGYGGILGVGQGSASPPRLVHLSYKGGRGAKKKVALVGKGITFDSGGLSLKPPTAMEEMKSDMGGAAAVIGAMRAVAQLGLPIDVEAWIPMAENMPSGTAIRPSDVLTMKNGLRVEVNNTDAEGRLILADAISRACDDNPDVVLDVATLTGAQLIALGARTTAVMANDDELRSTIVAAATRAGEPSWAMPLPAELRKGLDSDIADLVNTGPREGGMLTAGIFLQEFVTEGVSWAHLDIAGPAYNSGEAYGYTPHGGTGAAVRTFVQVLEDLGA